MPCYEVRTVTVEFRAENKRLLEAAVEELGWNLQSSISGNAVVRIPGSGVITLNLEKGTAKFDDYLQYHVNQLKRSYSKQTVKRLAKVQGWAVQWGEYDSGGKWNRNPKGLEARVSR